MAKSTQLMMDIGEGLSLMVGNPAIDSWDSQNRPKKARRGTIGFNQQTKSLECWNGSEWYHAPLREA